MSASDESSISTTTQTAATTLTNSTNATTHSDSPTESRTHATTKQKSKSTAAAAAAAAAASQISALPPLKILCLHGYTQTGPQFSSKTGALRKALINAFAPRSVELIYPSAPIRLRASDIPGFEGTAAPAQHHSSSAAVNGETPNSAETTSPNAPAHGDGEEEDEEIEAFAWWRRRDVPAASSSSSDTSTTTTTNEPTVTGLEEGLSTIASTITSSGPFDGIIGFSQGACAAAIVASLLAAAPALSAETLAQTPYAASFLDAQTKLPIQPPLKFALLYSGFLLPGTAYAPLWPTEDSIPTPSLHVLGSLDTVVSEERSLALVNAFRVEGFASSSTSASQLQAQSQSSTSALTSGLILQRSWRVILVHPGGHFVPSAKPWIGAAVAFVREVLAAVDERERS